MRYFICVICPPLAVLTTGRPFLFIFSIFLTILGWIPGMILAFAVVNNHYNKRRFEELKQRTTAD